LVQPARHSAVALPLTIAFELNLSAGKGCLLRSGLFYTGQQFFVAAMHSLFEQQFQSISI